MRGRNLKGCLLSIHGSGMIAAGHSAVMAQRHEPPDSLDFFPTPPWATRAFLRHVLPVAAPGLVVRSACDPAAGEGHMAEVLRETIPDVRASDVFDYGRGYPVADFLDARRPVARADLFATNPPFNAALGFALRMLSCSTRRSGWVRRESGC